MEYLALYRKWRPRGFDGFVGQPHVVRTLKNAVAQDRVGHAYLFCGPRGTGKTTAAKIFAKAVNCASPRDGDPCGECPSCKRITDGVSLDVQEIDGASNRGIDEVRDLREKVKFAPAEGRFRVYIIDEVHMLTGEAFNALLKTLEEPPAHVIFIFATTEPHKLPSTVLSRCQRFDFKRFSQKELTGRLSEIARAESIEAEPAALELIAVQAAGGMRDAIGLLEQTAVHTDQHITLAAVREVLGLVDLEVYRRLIAAFKDRDPAAALNLLTEVIEAGKDLAQFARGATGICRDLLVLSVTDDPVPLQIIPAGDEPAWRETAVSFGEERLLEAVGVLADTAGEQKRSGQGHLPLDLALLKLTTDLGARPEIERRLSKLEEDLARVLEAAPSHGNSGSPRREAKGNTPSGVNVKNPVKTARTSAEPQSPMAGEKAAGPADSGSGDMWTVFLSRMKSIKPSLSAYMDRFAKPAGITGDSFVLLFANKDFIAKVERDRQLVEKTLSEIGGRALTMNCKVGTTNIMNKKDEEDTLAEAVRIFDGTLEEE